MIDLRLIVMINRQRRIIQRCEHIRLDVPDACRIVMNAVKNILDMRIIQLHKTAFLHLCRSVLPSTADGRRIAAYCIDEKLPNLIDAAMIIWVADF